MFLYIICGMTRQGKSRYAKSLITLPKTIEKPCLVYDYQNEYGNTYNTLINGRRTVVEGVKLPEYQPNLKRCRFTSKQGHIKDFISIAKACRGRNIIFEEATIFLKGNTVDGIRDIVVSRFHDNNNIIFVFHRLAVVPKDIIDLADYLVLFKTQDNAKEVHTRYRNDAIDIAVNMQKQKKDGAAPTIVALKHEKINGVDVAKFATKTLF